MEQRMNELADALNALGPAKGLGSWGKKAAPRCIVTTAAKPTASRADDWKNLNLSGAYGNKAPGCATWTGD